MSKSKEFYDLAEFHLITHNHIGLKKLLSLEADLIILEPTGNYSQIWQDNLEDQGQEYKLVSNQRIIAARELCRWSAKDDQHDALALAYYGWINRENPHAFNRTRDPRLEKAYKLLGRQKRINTQRTPLVNQLRNLLSYELPEYAKTRASDAEKTNKLFCFIAKRYDLMKPPTVNKYSKEITKSIGRVGKTGEFSEESIKLARKIIELEEERASHYELYEEVLKDPDFQWMSQVMDEFNMETIVKVSIICQIYPFEQFLGENGNELRRKLKHRRSKRGNTFSKRTGYRKYHALLGKGLFERSSGKSKGYIVQGPKETKIQLYLWAERNIARRNGRSKGCFVGKEGSVIQFLQRKYDQDTATYSEVINNLQNLGKEKLEEGLEDIKKVNSTLKNDSPLKSIFRIITPLIEESIKTKKDVNQKRAKSILRDWALSRASDKAIKILFRKLVEAHRNQ